MAVQHHYEAHIPPDRLHRLFRGFEGEVRGRSQVPEGVQLVLSLVDTFKQLRLKDLQHCHGVQKPLLPPQHRLNQRGVLSYGKALTGE